MRFTDHANIGLFGWAMHAVGAALLLTTGIAYYLIFHTHCVESTIADTQRAEQLQQLLKAKEKSQDEIFALEHRATELERRVAAVRDRIPEKSEETKFLKYLMREANDQGIKILDFQRGTTTEMKTHSQIELKIHCEGRYEHVCSFIDRIHDAPRYVTIREMSIKSTASSDIYPVNLTLVLPFGKTIAERSSASDG